MININKYNSLRRHAVVWIGRVLTIPAEPRRQGIDLSIVAPS
jgi:hypothetical protein